MARILIVDDEPEIVQLSKIMLEKEGHDIEAAKNGEECLKMAKKGKYDIILLDVMMPRGIDGWEVCTRLKADSKTNDIPVVMFTVRTGPEYVAKGKDSGAIAQIDKPFGD